MINSVSSFVMRLVMGGLLSSETPEARRKREIKAIFERAIDAEPRWWIRIAAEELTIFLGSGDQPLRQRALVELICSGQLSSSRIWVAGLVLDDKYIASLNRSSHLAAFARALAPVDLSTCAPKCSLHKGQCRIASIIDLGFNSSLKLLRAMRALRRNTEAAVQFFDHVYTTPVEPPYEAALRDLLAIIGSCLIVPENQTAFERRVADIEKVLATKVTSEFLPDRLAAFTQPWMAENRPPQREQVERVPTDALNE
jgi:hypothetical protein